jgi:ribosomal protein S18 acetylase RimI-like enzyme
MLNIRAVNAADGIDVAKLLKEAHAASSMPIGPHWSDGQVAFECELQVGKMGFVVTSPTGSIDAFVLLQDTGAAWEITFLATAIAARGQGKMTSLLQYLIDRRPAEKPIWLEVHEANDMARRLYARLGFKQVGRRANYYSGGGAAVLYNYG